MKYLIDNAGQWWRMWSVRLAALAGVVAAYLAANPDQTQALLDVLPDGPLRVLASIGIGVAIFAFPTAARLAKQPSQERTPACEQSVIQLEDAGRNDAGNIARP